MNAPTAIRSLALTAWVAAAFCLLVSAVIFHEHFSLAAGGSWEPPQLPALRQQLGRDPKNAVLKEQIRQLDLNARRNLRHRLALDRTGARLLLVGGLGLIAAARLASTLARKPVRLPPKVDPQTALAGHATRARGALAVMGLIITGTLIGIRLGYPSILSDNPVARKPMIDNAALASPPVTEAAPLLVEFQTNWPRFRGWDGSGVCASPWSASSNASTSLAVVWKATIAAPGQNSPIVWGNRVFVSGGTLERREVFCYDASNGALLWQRNITNVSGSSLHIANLPDDTGCASPTMATDGRRVYVFFGNGDLAALKLDGSIAWSKYLGPIKNSYGHGASLAIWTNCVLVQLDQGDSKPAGSKLISLQGADGRVLWEASRPVTESWATPIVIAAGNDAQVVASGNPWAIGYTLANGSERWRANLLENEVVPSPVFADGLVLVANPGARLTALRANATGDVTKSGVAWFEEQDVSDIPSPVAYAGLAFTVTSGGVASCFQTTGGKKLWDHDLGLEINASPGIIDGHLVVLGKNGTVLILRAGREFQELFRTQFEDSFIGSPAFAGGQIFLRGATNLYNLAPSARIAVAQQR